MTQKKKLEIVRWNKKIQNRLNLDIKDYKEYSEAFSSIEIEIIPKKDNWKKDQSKVNEINQNLVKETIKTKFEIVK